MPNWSARRVSFILILTRIKKINNDDDGSCGGGRDRGLWWMLIFINDADADGDGGVDARPAPPPAAGLAPSPHMLAHLFYLFF